MLNTPWPLLMAWKYSANTKEMIAMSFMRMFREGPDVSFSGSPTVSPTTAACSAQKATGRAKGRLRSVF